MAESEAEDFVAADSAEEGLGETVLAVVASVAESVRIDSAVAVWAAIDSAATVLAGLVEIEGLVVAILARTDLAAALEAKVSVEAIRRSVAVESLAEIVPVDLGAKVHAISDAATSPRRRIAVS